MNKCMVTFDKSNEDIPTLVVARESFFAFAPGMDVIKVITGDKAVRVWNDLTGQEDIKAESEPQETENT